MDDKLYKFSRLAEIGSYTRAARELHISQPALTIAIQKLEKELGAQLFIRSGRRLKLTPAGKAALQAALEHQDVSTHLRESLNRLARKRPSVVIGMIDSAADKLCSTAAFERLESRADVTLIVNNSRYLREGVERRRIDAALIIDDELEHQGLSKQTIGHEQLRLVCHPDNLEEVVSSLEKGMLRSFISYDKPSTTYRHIQHHFSALGIHTHARLYSTSPPIMLGMVLRGKGCAVLPSHMVEPLIHARQLSGVLDLIQRPITLITTHNKQLPDFVDEFLHEVSSVMSDY
jgi:DNA-binding transcriptional LysR family regulator